MSNLYTVEIYTDGSCLGNPGPGGVGYILFIPDTQHMKEGSMGFTDATNNQMEVMAALLALQQITKPCVINLYSDSNYLVKGMNEWVEGWINKGWRKADNKPVSNLDVWQPLVKKVEDLKAMGCVVNFHWVKGHAGHPMNERADLLATLASKSVR